MKKLLSAFALALSVAACQGGGNGISSWYQAYGSSSFPGPKDGMAAVYIVRDVAAPEAPPIPITVGRQTVGSLAGSTWMRFDVPPDPYDLRAFGGQESTELIITVTAGETRFLVAEPVGGNNAKLMTLSQEDGRNLVRKGQQAATSYYASN